MTIQPGSGLVLALAFLGAAPVHAQTAARTADEVRAADMAFERRAEAAGAAQAFRDFMDEADGLQFNGGPPVRGAEAIYQATKPVFANARLQWTLVDAWGSKGGDMGVTTGTFRVSASDGKPVATGRYVTVWRKTAAGAWKGLIDIGAPDPR